MTSERLNRVTSKIEAAVERLSQLEPTPAQGGSPMLFEEPEGETARRHRREIEDRDRKIAKLRADIDDISSLKDEEIARLRGELARRSAPGGEAAHEHAALEKRYDRLKTAAEAAQQRLDRLIAQIETENG